MIDTSDDNVFSALRALDNVIADAKPVLFWVGSGISAWCGYPLWHGLAEKCHEEYSALDGAYDRNEGSRLLQTHSYPSVFSLCKTTSASRYANILKREFGPRPITAEYTRFIAALQRFNPLSVLTTNVDERLEQHLSHCAVVQRADLAYAITLRASGDPFIGKLHGSISSVETTVFTTEDYASLMADKSYLKVLLQLFTSHSLVVVGSSLSDDYLLRLLNESDEVKGIFGNGPHFIISSNPLADLPDSFRMVRYSAHSAIGHRATLQVLESVGFRDGRIAPSGEDANIASAYFLIDLFPPNVAWTTGMRTQLGDAPDEPRGTVRSMIRGLGFTPDEMPASPTTLHDVLVALTCFEKIHAPIETLPKFVCLLGGQLLTQILQENALEFIWWDAEEGIGFEDDATATGGLSSFVIQNPGNRSLTLKEKLAMIGPFAFESPAHSRTFTTLVAKVTTRIREGLDSPMCATIEASLSLPHIRRMLGFSIFTPPKRVPNWLAHPVLRVARLVRTAETCRVIQASSIKFPFGAKMLADALFASQSGSEFASNTANYVLYNSFRSTVPSTAGSYRELVRSILKFRQTAVAAQARNTILQHLARHDGSDCVAAIDATLKHAIPTTVLQNAREQFSEFLLPKEASLRHSPVVWKEALGDPVANWRAKSKANLIGYCEERAIKYSAPCPCGSTVSVQKCCLAALEGKQDRSAP